MNAPLFLGEVARSLDAKLGTSWERAGVDNNARTDWSTHATMSGLPGRIECVGQHQQRSLNASRKGQLSQWHRLRGRKHLCCYARASMGTAHTPSPKDGATNEPSVPSYPAGRATRTEYCLDAASASSDSSSYVSQGRYEAATTIQIQRKNVVERQVHPSCSPFPPISRTQGSLLRPVVLNKQSAIRRSSTPATLA